METADLLIPFLVAAGLGAIVGLERQVSKLDSGTGARTFALYSLWGAGSAYLAERFEPAALVAGLAALTVLIAVRYNNESKSTGDMGVTTELAAFVTFGVGVLAFDTMFVEAIALSVGLAALLRARDWIHRLGDRFSAEDVAAVLQFAVITAIVLPLAPDVAVGPFEAINPRQIWLMVVFVSGIGLAGYLAVRLLGERGLGLSGILGGLVSSTAVTLGFSRMSKSAAGLHVALVAGVVGASGLMYPRVFVEALVIARPLAGRLAIPLIGLGMAVIGTAVFWLVRSRDTPSEAAGEQVELTNPLNLATALQFGLLYGVIVFISKAVIDTFSESSLLVVAGLSGLNDVDAITLSTANLVADGVLTASVGAQAVMLAVAVNTVVKAAIAWTLGGRRLARLTAAVLLPAAAVAVAAMFFV